MQESIQPNDSLQPDKLPRKRESLSTFFRNSPFYGADIDPIRNLDLTSKRHKKA
jgi:hypothetical protein